MTNDKSNASHLKRISSLYDRGKFRDVLRHLRSDSVGTLPRVVTLTLESACLVQLGRYGDVIRLMKSARRKKIAMNSEFQMNVGLALVRMGRLAEARFYFSRALRKQSDPSKRADILHNLGNVLDLLDDTCRALKYYRAAVALRPRLAITNYHLGELLNRMGYSVESIRYVRRAAHLDPKNVDYAEYLHLLCRVR